MGFYIAKDEVHSSWISHLLLYIHMYYFIVTQRYSRSDKNQLLKLEYAGIIKYDIFTYYMKKKRTQRIIVYMKVGNVCS